MRIRALHLGLISILGLARAAAADSSATVTESVKDVDHGSSASAGTVHAPVGTRVGDGEFVKTGVQSRAELQLADLTITRLGANTIFNYSSAKNEVDLRSGTILFSKPKDGKEMDIKTASVTAAILGTTGFVAFHDHELLFGLIEGHARVTIAGEAYTIGAGQALHMANGGAPQVFAYNVPVLVHSSPMLTKFHHPLPNQVYIDRAVAEYNDLVARGFVQPPVPPYFAVTDQVFPGIPAIPIVAHSSAGMALQQFNNSLNPPPPPPPPPNGSNFPGNSN
ncbi:MAG TPA: FecR family protein [Candidatus Methylacidiphilales bacterium]